MELLATASLVLFYLALVAALVSIPLGFPGTWLMLVAAVVFAAVGDLRPAGSDWVPLLVVGLLAGTGELIELGIRIVGGRWIEVPTGAIVAAIVGGILGALVGLPVFLIGSLAGLLLGIFIGALGYGLIATRALGRALAMALAATCSQIVALFAKTIVGVAIIAYLTMVIF